MTVGDLYCILDNKNQWVIIHDTTRNERIKCTIENVPLRYLGDYVYRMRIGESGLYIFCN